MKIIFGSRKHHHVARISIFLIMVALIAGMVGCMNRPPEDLEIWDWYDLDAVRDNLDGRYLLMNDLNSATAGYMELASETANGGRGWWPIGTSNDGFAGSFNGQGYEIRDLFINRPNENYVGLFGFVDEGGVIENIGVVNAIVAGKQHVGGLVGDNLGTMTNSHSSGNVSGDQHIGALVGINEGTVANSHYNYNEVLINGENIITIGALFDEDFEQWLANDKFLDVNQRLSQEDSYYLINTVSDFKELLAFGQDGSLEFRLTKDLDLGNEANFYIPYLAGDFDGNGHKIFNLGFNFDFVSQVGLFGYLASSGKVTQAGVENVNITGTYLVGGLVGGNDGTVGNSYSSGNVTGDDCVGGLVGYNWKGTVSNSYSTSSVAGSSSIGGLVGINEGTVANSYSSGSVTSWYSVGGLVGINEGTMTNSYSSGSVTGWYSVGGLVGINSEIVSHSHSTASVTGNYYVGGLLGGNNGTVGNCYSVGNVTGEWDVGGLVGSNYDTVKNSYSTGSVTGNHYVGGLAGVNDGALSYSYSTGSVAGEWDVGGLLGGNDGTVGNCYSAGNVTGNYYVGGLVGGNDDTVRNSYSTGSVTGNYYVGGMMGINGWDDAVRNSYSTGSVTGNYYVGGMVGVNFGTVINSYSSGNVTGDEYVGGMVGVNWVGIVNNSFWDTKTSGQATSAGGTGKTTAEMQDITTFLGVAWDICTVVPGSTNPFSTWNMVRQQTYPFLGWQSVV
jgi:hypothetical protein